MHLHRRGDDIRRKEVAHCIGQATADRPAHLVDRRRRPAELGQGVRVGPMDRRERIHEGAIEVEQYVTEGHAASEHADAGR